MKEQWSRIEEVFLSALEHKPESREAFVQSVCAGDEALRSEVETLLRSHVEAGDFIEAPVFQLPPDTLKDEREVDGELKPGEMIGDFRIIKLLGEGGMGEVYLGEDTSLERKVALKFVKQGFSTRRFMRRFRQEEKILATLNDPRIARLYGGATAPDGSPYFIMEYVDGLRLDEYAAIHKLSVAGRLKLFRKVCVAVEHAHQNLIIHRDLKPSNILVMADGEPKLLDFGIAKLVNAETEDAETVTELGVMTPEYASPEQICGRAVTTATDVYSLGVVLYELLTGCRPYRLTSRRPDEMARVVCEEEPKRPSQVISDRESKGAGAKDISYKPQPEIRNLKSLRGDLDNIVMKAMRKEPARRYASVAQFSEDIRRHLEGLPVIAHKDTFAYRAGKFIRRNKAGVATAALVVLTLVGGIIATTWQARRAIAEARRAQNEAIKAERINAFLQNTLSFSNLSWLSPNPRRNRDATIAEALAEAGRRAETELADQPEVLAAVRFTIGFTYATQSRFAEAETHLQAALDIRRRTLGNRHQETAQSMVGLGGLYTATGRIAEGEALYREAIAVYRRAQPTGDVDAKWFVIALTDYGLLQQYVKGDAATGEAIWREALEISSGFTGEDRAAVAILEGNLGNAQAARGDVAGAESYYRRAIEEFRRLPGSPRVEMATYLLHLGNSLSNRGEYDQAEPLLLEAYELSRGTLGDTHYSTGLSLISLGYFYYRRGNYQRAMESADRALEILRTVLPPDHSDISEVSGLRGIIMTRTGEAARGEPLIRAWLETQRRTLTNPGPIMYAQGILGENLTAQRRYREAEPLLLESYNVMNARYGAHNPFTVEAARRLVALYEAWAKPDRVAEFRALLVN
jgi:eukaryotic-like serine/threonine-protein kinase